MGHEVCVGTEESQMLEMKPQHRFEYLCIHLITNPVRATTICPEVV